VRDVLPLDAFARCWVHEHVFYEAVHKLIPEEKRSGYARLLAEWEAANLARYRQALLLTAQQLAAAVRDSQAVAGETKGFLHSAMKAVGLGKDELRRQEAAMATLAERLNLEIGKTTAQLLALHKLDPGEASRINARVRDNFAIRAPLDKAQAGLLGAVVSGAATGLSADLMAGGLTMGGGAILGAIVGALTMAGAAWGFNVRTERNQPTVQFADAFLQTLLVGSILRYLAVAHFGRGRGNFVEGEAPAFWQVEVESAVASQADSLGTLWSAVRAAPDSPAAATLVNDLVTRLADATLARLYPATMAGQAQPLHEPATGVSSAS
jgi:hypothetical protein